MKCARQRAGAQRSASPTPAGACRPDLPPRRRRACLCFLVPVLALLLCGLHLIAAAPVSAQATTWWSATLTVGDLGDEDVGCDSLSGGSTVSCNTLLTNSSFTVGGTTHTFTRVWDVRDSQQSLNSLEIRLQPALASPPQDLKFCVGTTAYALPDTSFHETFWSVDAGWSVGDTVQLSIGTSCSQTLQSSNADLSGLTAGGSDSASGTFTPFTLSPAFDKATTSYTATVANSITHVKLTPTVDDTGKATVQVGLRGTTLAAVTDGTASGAVALAVGSGNVFTVRVTAEDGTTKDYTVTVTRQAQDTPTQDTPTVRLRVRPNPVAEGESVAVRAHVSTRTVGGVKIPVIVRNGTSETSDWGERDDPLPPADGTRRYVINVAADIQNVSSGLVNIPTHRDSDTDDETFTVALDTARLPAGYAAGTPSSVEVRITDLDEPHVETVRLEVSRRVPEGSDVAVNAMLSSGLAADVTIPLTVRAITSEAGDHGTLASITIPAGRCCRTGFISTTADDDGDDERFTVALGTPLPAGLVAGSPASVEVTIYEGDTPPTADTPATEGSPPTGDTPPTGGTSPGGGGGGVAPVLAPSFGDATVADQVWTPGAAVALVLPRATGGDGTLRYRLTPAPPAGLTLDAAVRLVAGTPSRARDATEYTWTATDADGDTATLAFSIEVADPRRAWVKEAVRRALAAAARRAMSSALENIGARFGDVGASGLTLAGQAVTLDAGTAPAADFAAAQELRPCAAERFGAGCAAVAAGREIGAEELLRASAFSLLLGAAEGPLWSVWGRGDWGSFAGRGEPGLRYDGKLRTGWLGLDARAGPWVAGLAVSHGEGEADYGLSGGRGRLETTLTAAYPYGRWTLANGLELRAVVGAGWGEARHEPEGEEAETGDLTMRMASVGVRRALPDLAGMALAVRADASVTRLETDAGPDAIHALSAEGWRLRAGIEARRRFALAGGWSVEPFLEAAVRRDGGDGLEGSGFELAGGVRYAATGVAVEMRGRWLAAHSEDGAEEKGVSLTARVGPGAGDGRGLWFALAPRWGAATGGADALWAEEMPTPSAAGQEALDARVGYGFWLPEAGGVLTPFAEADLAGGESRRLRLGTRFEVPGGDLRVELAGERRESAAAETGYELGLDLRLRF